MFKRGYPRKIGPLFLGSNPLQLYLPAVITTVKTLVGNHGQKLLKSPIFQCFPGKKERLTVVYFHLVSRDPPTPDSTSHNMVTDAFFPLKWSPDFEIILANSTKFHNAVMGLCDRLPVFFDPEATQWLFSFFKAITSLGGWIPYPGFERVRDPLPPTTQ